MITLKPILFPGLGLEFNIDNVAFNLFGKDIYWYGIIIVFGMFVSLLLAKRDRNNLGISWDNITEFLVWAILVGIVCARAYYVIFKWDYYSKHVGEIYKIWNGGIAIYGGIIGALLTGMIFCKVKKIKFLNLCDFCAPYLALAQSIGRWGNFVNREAFGEVTDSVFRMGIFDISLNDYIYVHPTFLYESLVTFFIFVLLMIIRNNKKFDGEFFYLYMILYGVGRFFIEGLRTDSLMSGSFRISQILAAFFVFVFFILYIYSIFRRKCLSQTVERKKI